MNKGVFYNIPDKFKFSIAFDSNIKPIVSEDKDKYLALASAENLKKFIPEGLNITDNIDLLPWAGNFCVANKINLNDDGITTKQAIQIVKLLNYKFVDLEHERDTIFGCILSAGYSEYGNDKPLTEEQIKDYTKPFNITVGGIIWRVINPDFADKVEELGSPESKYKISLSWELAFSEYDLLLIDSNKTNIEDGKLISDASEIAKLEKSLRALGGSGKTETGKKIARIIKNDVLPIGAGFVEQPAGQVGQIVTNQEDKESNASLREDITTTIIEVIKKELQDGGILNKDSHASEHFTEKCSCGEIISNCRCSSPDKKIIIKENGCKKCQDSISQAKNLNVKTDTTIKSNKKIMLKSIKDITDENLKEATASEIIKAHKIDVDAEVEKINQEFIAKKEKTDKELKASADKQAELEKTVKETNEKLAKAADDLAKLVKANEDREQEETFTARMSYFDKEYELDDKTRNSVAKRIKGLDEESYKSEKEDLETLLAAKKKGFVPFKKKGEDDGDGKDKEGKKEDKKESKASLEDKDDAVSDAIDKGKKETVVAAATTTGKETEADKWKRNFGEEAWEVDSRRFGRK